MKPRQPFRLCDLMRLTKTTMLPYRLGMGVACRGLTFARKGNAGVAARSAIETNHRGAEIGAALRFSDLRASAVYPQNRSVCECRWPTNSGDKPQRHLGTENSIFSDRFYYCASVVDSRSQPTLASAGAFRIEAEAATNASMSCMSREMFPSFSGCHCTPVTHHPASFPSKASMSPSGA